MFYRPSSARAHATSHGVFCFRAIDDTISDPGEGDFEFALGEGTLPPCIEANSCRKALSSVEAPSSGVPLALALCRKGGGSKFCGSIGRGGCNPLRATAA